MRTSRRDRARERQPPRGKSLARDPRSGKEEVRFQDVPAYWFHHRCYPAKATEDYLIMSRTGTEFVNTKTGEWTLHHWVRGACLYGIMPANGSALRPPASLFLLHRCQDVRVHGVGARELVGEPVRCGRPPTRQRLTVIVVDAAAAFPEPGNRTLQGEWPTYRG